MGFTLGPGQSARITLPIRPNDHGWLSGSLDDPEARVEIEPFSAEAAQFSGHLVPPPATAPVQDFADTLGLPPGLRAVQSAHQFRCCACRAMKANGSVLVWVPDSVRRGDPFSSVTEAARLGAWNGGSSGWCLRCCSRWIRKPRTHRWWKFWSV